MINLQSNAIKFTKDEGKVVIETTFIPKVDQREIPDPDTQNISSPGVQNKLLISVKDNGVGIKETDKRNLFKMFGSLNNTKAMNTHGIGLGLFICKEIVMNFKGAI